MMINDSGLLFWATLYMYIYTVNDVSASSGIISPKQAVNSMSKQSLRWIFT